ncbi:MAG: citrate (Si)-synthase [Candidatus Lindowbacteria bacterium]|nr:citrate (Si)-synthase [Candidatus Lindowbacteria bacterium]
MKLASRLEEIFDERRDSIKTFIKGNGDKVVSEVTIKQIYGGARGVRCLPCDTSSVEQDKGVSLRGYPINDLADRTPEQVLYLLLTGELPDEEATLELEKDLRTRRVIPDYVWRVLEALPENAHPMTLFTTGILAMQSESKFAEAYEYGAKKEDYWRSTLEDCLDIVARVPVLAAGIYRMRFGHGDRIAPDENLDLSHNFAKLLGIDDPTGDFAELMRLYLVLHSDHESGNVSANTVATVNSALSDLYYSLSAGMSGLAGPLHGLANQECLKWILMVHDKFGGVPTKEEIEKFAWDTLDSGKVIPGYGHAVLRVTDPRFDGFYAFGKSHCADDPVFQIVMKVFETVPEVLKQVKKIKDPWPNVDAISGSLLYKYGVKEFPFYTVLFGVSRAIGVCSQAVLARGLGLPLVRPKSVTTEWLMKQAASEALV